MRKRVSYGLAISDEILGCNAPVLLQGGLEKSIIRASEMGFDSVEIHIRKPFKFNPERILKITEDYNIKISAIGTGLENSLNGYSLTSPDKSIRRKMSDSLKEHIDLAELFNSVVFLGLLRGTAPDFETREEYLNMFVEEINPIVLYAEKKGVVLALEPIVFYMTNLLNTTEETLEFLERKGLGSVQLLLDTHHMFIEDRDMFESFRMCKGKIAHIHISDSNRRYPLGGNVDYKKVGEILKEIQYDKAVSLEVLPYPSGEEAALNGLKWMKSIWGQ